MCTTVIAWFSFKKGREGVEDSWKMSGVIYELLSCKSICLSVQCILVHFVKTDEREKNINFDENKSIGLRDPK